MNSSFRPPPLYAYIYVEGLYAYRLYVVLVLYAYFSNYGGSVRTGLSVRTLSARARASRLATVPDTTELHTQLKQY